MFSWELQYHISKVIDKLATIAGPDMIELLDIIHSVSFRSAPLYIEIGT